MADQDQTNAEATGEAAAPKRIEFTIQNIPFEAEARYAPGHTINAAEASVLNQTLVENLRNNFAGRIKLKTDAAKKEGRDELTAEEIDELKAQFNDYEAEYVFQGKRATRAPVDPVRKEANKMAREAVTAALRTKGIDPKNLVDGKMEELMANYLQRFPAVVEEAKRRVESVKALAEGALAGVEISDADLTPAEPQAEPAQ